MSNDDVRAALQRHWKASDANDFDAEHQIYRADAVLEYLSGGGDLWISELILTYDEEPYYVVSIMEFEEAEVIRETQYFGEAFEPGPSRAQWVEEQ